MMVSFMVTGNQCMQLIKVLYCDLPTFGKQLPAFKPRVQGVDPQTFEVKGGCYHCNKLAPTIVPSFLHCKLKECINN